MAKQNRIKKVTVHYPTKENKAEFDRRAARAVAKVLCEMYPPYVIDEITRRLKRLKNN